MIDLLTEPPAGFVLSLAALLFAACLAVFLARRTRMARCGAFVAGAAVLLTGAAALAMIFPLSIRGTACGMPAGALDPGAAAGGCRIVAKTVFDTALWLGLGGAAAAFLSFAPGLRTVPSMPAATGPDTADSRGGHA